MRTLFFHHYTEKGQIFHGDLNTNTIREAIREAIACTCISRTRAFNNYNTKLLNCNVSWEIWITWYKLNKLHSRFSQRSIFWIQESFMINYREMQPIGCIVRTMEHVYFKLILLWWELAFSRDGAIKIELKDALDRNSDFLKGEIQGIWKSMKIWKSRGSITVTDGSILCTELHTLCN